MKEKQRKQRNVWEGYEMTFVFKKIKPKARRKKGDPEKILERLNLYLQDNDTAPVKFLVSFWNDQKTAFTYKEIREAILAGRVPDGALDVWRQDYSKLVAERMKPLWTDAMKAGSRGQPIFDGLPDGFKIKTGVPDIIDWIEKRGASFVTAVTDEQKKAIKALLEKKVLERYSVDELARIIRPCVGLTEGQAKANLRYYEHIKESLKKNHPRMKPENVEKKAREAQIKYAAKQNRQRAYTIAHTEMAFAYNKGSDATVRQAQKEGLLGEMERRWVTSGKSNVCSICSALDGTQIGMDDEFDFKGKSLFPGQKQTPPAHPRCCCAIQYIETSPPIIKE